MKRKVKPAAAQTQPHTSDRQDSAHSVEVDQSNEDTCDLDADEEEAYRPYPASIERKTWLMVALMILPGLLLSWNQWTRVIFIVLDVMVHETGHAIFAWAAGRGAIPRLDFQYGGGVTPITDQHWFFLTKGA